AEPATKSRSRSSRAAMVLGTGKRRSSCMSNPSSLKNPSSAAAIAGKYEFDTRSGTARRMAESPYERAMVHMLWVVDNATQICDACIRASLSRVEVDLIPYSIIRNMTIRFDPTTRTLWLSIRDLVDTTAFPGSVSLTLTLRSRAAMGRETHAVHQAAQQAALPSYRAEVTIRQQFLIEDYTVHLQGRIDGLYEDQNTLI